VRYNRLDHEKVLRVNLAVCLGAPFHTPSVNSSPLPGLSASNRSNISSSFRRAMRR
jgi:hypothetical protein